MTRTGRIGLLSLLAALLLGLLGDQLILAAQSLGLGFTLWVVALALATLGVARWAPRGPEPTPDSGPPQQAGQDDVPKPPVPEPHLEHTPASPTALTGEGRWLLMGAVLFAAGLLWRGSPLLQVLDLLAIGICLGLAALTLRGGRLSRTGVISYPLGLLLSAAHHITGPLLLLFSDVPWNRLPRGRASAQVAAVLRGLLIALPLLFIFGGLFTAADAIFGKIVSDLFSFDLGGLMEHLFGTLLFGALAAGFLRTSLLVKTEALPQVPPATGFTLGRIETGLVLGLLNLLFLAFVVVQIRYLFGGADLVLAAADLTYAEYARRGFFELVQVSALVLPMLLALHWLIPAGQALEHRLFRWLGGSLVALLFLIMASALQRMWLYQQEYGMTELRLYTTAFMGWMALLFVWFVATVLRGQRERFAVGALVSGLLVLVVLHAINPDALIMRANLRHMGETGRFDAPYAVSLGPDAVPILIEALPQLSETDQEQILTSLSEQSQGWGNRDWRGWNWGWAKAVKASATLPTPQP